MKDIGNETLSPLKALEMVLLHENELYWGPWWIALVLLATITYMVIPLLRVFDSQ